MIENTRDPQTSMLEAVSTALVRLHKEQFGRGPTRSRSGMAGDVLVCVMYDAMLPAERKMVELGERERVRENRIAFQTATEREFIETVENIVGRKVIAFASGIDPDNGTVFENFVLAPREDGDTSGVLG
jgi:uncharacterized protein YbcI